MLLVDWNARKGMGYTPGGRKTVFGLYTEGISVRKVFGDDMGGNWMEL